VYTVNGSHSNKLRGAIRLPGGLLRIGRATQNGGMLPVFTITHSCQRRGMGGPKKKDRGSEGTLQHLDDGLMGEEVVTIEGKKNKQGSSEHWGRSLP